VDWAWESTALTVLGLGAGALAAADRSSKVRRAPGLRKRFALVAMAIVAGATQVPGLVSAQRIRASDAELAVGETARADELAQDAIDAQPWAAGPHAQRALVALEAGNATRAKREANAAIAHEPSNWRHWLLKAQADLDAGDEEAAGRAAEIALGLHPSAPAELESILDGLGASRNPG
jgi:Tfp pilus assembly protein PilF